MMCFIFVCIVVLDVATGKIKKITHKTAIREVDAFTQKHPLENGYLHFSESPLSSAETVKLFQHREMLSFSSTAAKKTNTTAVSEESEAKISNMDASIEIVDASYTSGLHSRLENVSVVPIHSAADYLTIPGSAVWIA